MKVKKIQDDASIFDELIDKTDEELKKEFREMKEKEAKLAPKKLEELTDEEFFELFKEAKSQKFGNQKNVEEKQKEKEKEEADPSSCKSREHSFEFTPGGSQPSFNLGFDTPEEESKEFKKKGSNEEEKEYRLLESPYINEKVSTTEELTEE